MNHVNLTKTHLLCKKVTCTVTIQYAVFTKILHVDAYNFLLNRRIYDSESTCRLVLIIVSITKIPKTSIIGALSSSIRVKNTRRKEQRTISTGNLHLFSSQCVIVKT